MSDDTPTEPLFRAKKRRKIFRKRSDSDAFADLQAEISINEPDPLITKQTADGEDAGAEIVKVHQKGSVRKHGIGFSSAESRRVGKPEENAETAVVLTSEHESQQAPGSDRFVRPTATPLSQHDVQRPTDSEVARSTTNNEEHGAHQDALDTRKAMTTFQQAQARSTRVYERPTKRRPPPQRDQVDVARDTMIEKIMNESQVPIYDSNSIQKPLVEDDGGDNDAATAEAFKAQLLAEMEQQNRRRPPATKPGSKEPKMQSGPKLGGSRSQREKMRAMEEAKSGSGKK